MKTLPSTLAVLALATPLALAACATHSAAKAASAGRVVVRENLPIAPTPTPAESPLPSAMSKFYNGRWNISVSDSDLVIISKDGTVAAVRPRTGERIWTSNASCDVSAALLDGDRIILGFRGRSESSIAIVRRSDGMLVRPSVLAGTNGISAFQKAGASVLVVEGWIDGAALVNTLSFLNMETLRPMADPGTGDSTFLGVIGDRAYIDDWCCNGRADQYRPATIFSISLRDGAGSKEMDLRPEPQLHPGREQPLGQGEHNYMLGKYLFVVVGDVTYRYDVTNLRKPFLKMRTPV